MHIFDFGSRLWDNYRPSKNKYLLLLKERVFLTVFINAKEGYLKVFTKFPCYLIFFKDTCFEKWHTDVLLLVLKSNKKITIDIFTINTFYM